MVYATGVALFRPSEDITSVRVALRGTTLWQWCRSPGNTVEFLPVSGIASRPFRPQIHTLQATACCPRSPCRPRQNEIALKTTSSPAVHFDNDVFSYYGRQKKTYGVFCIRTLLQSHSLNKVDIVDICGKSSMVLRRMDRVRSVMSSSMRPVIKNLRLRQLNKGCQNILTKLHQIRLAISRLTTELQMPE